MCFASCWGFKEHHDAVPAIQEHSVAGEEMGKLSAIIV